MSAPTIAVTRAEAEDFLYLEAELLDEWKLDEWLGLYEEGGTFEVPTTDWTGWDSLSGGFFVLDDWELLKARVKRLKSRKAHAENPHSRTHRLISNVRVVLPQIGTVEDGTAEIRANFVINRFRDGTHHTYVGRYRHTAVVTAEGLRLRHRRAVLVHELLEPGARLSFIL